MRLTYLSKLLNISEHEWPRVIVSWIITFFLRTGFIIGWTVMIAMFVNRIGIDQLPLLFIINALLVILGTILFSGIIEKIRKEILIIINILLAATLLVASTLFIMYSNWIFFGLVLIAESVILAQLNILISLFVEEFFTPLESQRTFPIIESSETIGAIAGGLIISLFAHQIPSYKFIYVWVLLMMLVIPIMLSFRRLNTDIPVFEQKEEHESGFKKIKENFKKSQKSPFLKGLIIVIMLQWMFANILEFQFTKSVQQDVYNEQEETIVYENNLNQSFKASILNADELKNTETTTIQGTTHTTTEEGNLTAKLGLLQIIFGAATLIMQLLISSRILKSLGIVKSMRIHPLISTLNIIAMTLRFNILTASFSKGIGEMTGLLFMNAYHSSYYAFKENLRDQLKELFEGIIKPCGAILGMSLIVLLENYFVGPNLTMAINMVLISITVVSTGLISSLQAKYTEESQKNLEKGNSMHTRINAIEILAQKGHKIDYHKLIKLIQRDAEDEEIKIKAIATLKQIKDPQTVPDIITCLYSKSPNIRLAIVDLIGEFKDLGKQFFKSAFAKYRIEKTLKEAFETETNEEIRSEIIKVLAYFDPKDIVPFLLEKINSNEEKIIADCIYICGLFHDPNSIYYLEKFLDHKNPRIRANAIIALWQFKKLRQKLNHYLDQLLDSPNEENLMAGIYVIGELTLKEKKKKLLALLKNNNPEILFALAKLSDKSALVRLVDYIIEHKEDWDQIRKRLMALPEKFISELKQYLHQEISHKIHKILKAHSHLKFEEFDNEILKELEYLYAIIEESSVRNKIKNLIKND